MRMGKMMVVDPKVKENPANRSEIGGLVTSQSDRGDGELQDEEKTMKLKTQIHWLAMVKKARQKTREKPNIGI